MSVEEPLDTLTFITQQLESAGVNFYVHKNDVSVPCPFGCSLDRTEYKQKLQIHFTGEMIHCWVCKTSGNWNKLAKVWGMKTIPLHTRNSISSLERELLLIEEQSSSGKPKLPKGLEDFVEDWRGIPGDFLRRIFDSKLFFDALSKVYRILWPVTFNGKLQGWVAGYLESAEGKPKPPYRNGIKSKGALFGIDTSIVASSSTVVLVEGPYDCIRLQYEGIPAVSILGTGNWDPRKVVMLKQRKSGPTNKVIIAFDGDNAGDLCRPEAYRDLKPIFGKDVILFDVPEGKDPGAMSDTFVDELRTLL